MQIRNISFDSWLRSHQHKKPKERWLRELYPWPVFGKIACGKSWIDVPQSIVHDGVVYVATLRSAKWQPSHGTYRYRLHLLSKGLGWHARSFDDKFDLCATRDGQFVTLFHCNKQEPLERIARAFFSRRWDLLKSLEYRSLAVSRFLAASLGVEVALRVYEDTPLTHYPNARVACSGVPMLAHGRKLWIRHHFFAEAAYSWARRNADRVEMIQALYFADTKYQYKRDLPANAKVHSIAELDSTFLNGEYYDLIITLARHIDLPSKKRIDSGVEDMLKGTVKAEPQQITEADVHEALASLRRPCRDKDELRYQLAAGIVLNAWIEEERALGYRKRKKFYAFKKRIAELVDWAVTADLDGVYIWSEQIESSAPPLVFIRIDEVDFSFHALPVSENVHMQIKRCWNGVRLKPIAPIVLSWARMLVSLY